MRRHAGRKYTFAAVYPEQGHRQAGQQLGQGMADVAATKQRNRHALRVQPQTQRRQAGGADSLQTQVHHAAAALAQRGAQRHAHDFRDFITLPCQQFMRPCNRLVFQMPAAYGAKA